MLKCLIWDVDGTLSETEETHRKAFNLTFKQFGYNWEWSQEKYRDLLEVTGGVERILFFIKTDLSLDIQKNITVDKVREMHKAKTVNYVNSIKNGFSHLRSGVQRLITEAKENDVRLAIATTTSLINVEMLLEYAPNSVDIEWFEVIGSANSINKKKPDPEIYLWTLDKLKLRPQDCLALEDSLNGLKAASSAGIPTIITYSNYTKHQKFDGAVAISDSFGNEDRPMRLISGEQKNKSFVDLELLKFWHSSFIK